MKIDIKKISLWLAKVFSGFCLAYVLAYAGQEFISYGDFSFVFIILSIMGGFLYLLKGYGFIILFVVDSCLIVLAVLLRLYVLIAYGF